MNNFFHKFPVDKFDIMEGDLIEYAPGIFMWVRHSDINSLGYAGSKLEGEVLLDIKGRLRASDNVWDEAEGIVDILLDFYLDENDVYKKDLYMELIRYAVKHYLK